MGEYAYIRASKDKNGNVRNVPFVLSMADTHGRYMPRSGKKYETGTRILMNQHWRKWIKKGIIEIVNNVGNNKNDDEISKDMKMSKRKGGK